MTRIFLIGWTAAWLALMWAPASAQQRVNLALCADPEIAPLETINFCTRALVKEKLSDRERVGVLINRGAANFVEGRFRSAIGDYSEAEALDPSQFVIFANRAGAHAKLGQTSEALRDYAQALAMRPNDRLSLLGRGGLYLSTGDGKNAFKDFDKASRLDPRDPDALFNRGLAAQQMEDFRQAESDFTRVVALAPLDAEAHLFRARVRLALDAKAAMGDFGRAIALAPEDPRAWYERGKLHDSQGRTEQANQDFRRAFELGHPSAWLQERIRSLVN